MLACRSTAELKLMLLTIQHSSYVALLHALLVAQLILAEGLLNQLLQMQETAAVRSAMCCCQRCLQRMRPTALCAPCMACCTHHIVLVEVTVTVPSIGEAANVCQANHTVALLLLKLHTATAQLIPGTS